MRHWLTALAVLLGVSIVQAYALPYFRVADVRLDPMMIVLIAWAFVRDGDEAMLVVPLGGLFLSLLSQEPLGASVVAYAPIVPLAGLKELRVTDSEVLLASVVALVATFSRAIILLLVLEASGDGTDWSRALVRITIPAAFFNMVAAPVAVAVARRLLHSAPRLAGRVVLTQRGRRRLELP